MLFLHSKTNKDTIFIKRYLFNIILQRNSAYNIRNIDKAPLLKRKHNFFKNSFFPSTVIEWNKLDPNLRNEDSFHFFKKSILQFIKPSSNSFLTAIILNESSSLEDCALVSVTYVNISLNAVSKTT